MSSPSLPGIVSAKTRKNESDDKDEVNKTAKIDDAMPVSVDTKFRAELEASPLAIFKPVADLGYFGWNPNLKIGYKDVSAIDDPNELKQQIHVDGVRLPVLVDTSKITLPRPFVGTEGKTFWVRCPFKTPIIVPLYVAKHHFGLDLKEVLPWVSY